MGWEEYDLVGVPLLLLEEQTLPTGLQGKRAALLSAAGAVDGASAVGTWEESEMPEVSFTREIL